MNSKPLLISGLLLLTLAGSAVAGYKQTDEVCLHVINNPSEIQYSAGFQSSDFNTKYFTTRAITGATSCAYNAYHHGPKTITLHAEPAYSGSLITSIDRSCSGFHADGGGYTKTVHTGRHHELWTLTVDATQSKLYCSHRGWN